MPYQLIPEGNVADFTPWEERTRSDPVTCLVDAYSLGGYPQQQVGVLLILKMSLEIQVRVAWLT